MASIFRQLFIKLVNTVSPRDGVMSIFNSENKKRILPKLVIAPKYTSIETPNKDDEHYLNSLLSDVEQGKRHHNVACFYDNDAEDVFRSIKHTLAALMGTHSSKLN